MPHIDKVYLTFSGMYPHVFFIRWGQTETHQWRGFYPTEAQLSNFAERIRKLARKGMVEITAHDFGWVARRKGRAR